MNPESESQDVFIRNRPMQPKVEVVRALADLGIVRMPRVFADIEEAVEFLDGTTDTDVIFRSESPDEYDGPSGLYNSLRLRLELASFRERGQTDKIEEMLKMYAGIDTEDDSRNMYFEAIFGNYNHKARNARQSLSYWEVIRGTQVSVVRDSAREDTLHFVNRGGWLTEIEGNLTTHLRNQRNKLTDNQYLALAEQFRQIESSGLFDPNTVYLTEFVVGDDGNIYCVQVHNTKNKRQGAAPRLDHEKYADWAKAAYCMGRTVGEQCFDIQSVISSIEVLELGQTQGDLNIMLKGPVGSFARSFIGTRADLMILDFSFDTIAAELGGHDFTSVFFKPKLVILPSQEDAKNYDNDFWLNRKKQFSIEVVSDGYDAYYRRA